MTIMPKKESQNENLKHPIISSYVMDPGFFKREMAKKG